MAAQAIIAYLEGLPIAVADEWADAAAVRMKQTLEEVSPSPDWSENIYATGEMQRSWVIERIGVGQRRVYNTADHAGYADEGYTRQKGKASARPYGERGGEDYTQQAVEQVMPELSADMQRRLEAYRANR